MPTNKKDDELPTSLDDLMRICQQKPTHKRTKIKRWFARKPKHKTTQK